MGSNVRHLTASSAFLVPALIAVATIGFTANPNNGKVQFRALTDTLGNQIGIEFRIEDPDKIASYAIFRGIRKPGMGNQESWWAEDCTKATVTNSLTGAAHLGHDHVITYADCEAARHESSWGTYRDENGRLPSSWTDAEKVRFDSQPDDGGGEDQRQAALSEKTLMWTQVTAAMVAVTLLLSLVAVFRSRRG